eukprot:TRINITY_DN3246_c0_g3_i1.p1 TRINITY_DN3246_c0_g3~~TRINITY_DN3246_c0_g3_i1.p1  ORF type:complete len:194 (+),score=63.44 TRINITY_DN3246_c0_g3_i1:183-764(+)
MSLGHIVSGALSSIVFIFLVAVTADGRSLMTSKSTPYASGVLRDQFGMQWHHQNHLLRPCGDHENPMTAVGTLLIVTTVLMLFTPLINLLGMSTGRAMWGKLAVGNNLIAAVLLISAFGTNATRFTTELECYGQSKVKLLDAYHANYAIPIMLIGFVTSLINTVVLVMTDSLNDHSPFPQAEGQKGEQEMAAQ